MRRLYTSFSVVRGFREHFNHSIGRPVSSERQFRSELARASDEYSARTGIEANFQPVYPADVAHTVNGEGLEATHRQEVAEGKREVRTWR